VINASQVNDLQLTIPAQDDSRTVKVRAREVRAWLDNLPYLDLQRAARLASHQLRLINRQRLPAGARLQITGDFLATYTRLGEALPAREDPADRTGQLLKRLCQDIGFGYKIVVQDLAASRTRLLEGRNLSLSLLGAMHTLGVQLLHYYASYQSAPRALWHECLALYRFARQRGRHTCSANLPGVGERQLDSTFRGIALLRYANPYGLGPGMALALQHYLNLHTELGRLEYGEPEEDAGPFITLTDSAQQAPPAAAESLRIALPALLDQIRRDIETLERYRLARSIGLSEDVPGTAFLHTLRRLLAAWESSRSRGQEREAAHATIELVVGFDSCYCVLNQGRPFEAALSLTAGQDDCIDLGSPAPPERSATSEPVATIPCHSLNRSPGGVALSYRGADGSPPRVGQLLALRRARTAANRWVLGVCRWLVEVESGAGFDIGVQYLARDARPVVIRASDAAGGYGDYRPAFSTSRKQVEPPVHMLLTQPGTGVPGERLTVQERGRQYSLRCVELLEAGPGFERLALLPCE
jgi:hypothetical protein